MSAGLMAIARLRPLTSAPAALAVEPGTVRVLSPSDARILAAVAERMVATGDPTMPRFGDTAGLQTIDTALLQLPASTHEQLHWALLLFQYGPPVFAIGLS